MFILKKPDDDTATDEKAQIRASMEEDDDLHYPKKKMLQHCNEIGTKKGIIKKDAFFEHLIHTGNTEVLALNLDGSLENKPEPFKELFEKIKDDEAFVKPKIIYTKKE